MATQEYMLVTYWCWDHFHNEYSTIAIEMDSETDESIESVFDSNAPHYLKNYLIGILKSIFDTRERSSNISMGKGKMIRLFKIVGSNGCPFGISPIPNHDCKEWKIGFTLKPICDFDRDGNPIPLGSLYELKR
ncbi:MAG: hypothetical protein WC473_03125 [Patescibacteria group bacterium]